jgi:hypothetical protein
MRRRDVLEASGTAVVGAVASPHFKHEFTKPAGSEHQSEAAVNTRVSGDGWQGIDDTAGHWPKTIFQSQADATIKSRSTGGSQRRVRAELPGLRLLHPAEVAK